jgi:very-short-patch-repair endonuclease
MKIVRPLRKIPIDVPRESKKFARALRRRKTNAEDIFARTFQSWKARGLLPKCSLRSQRPVLSYFPDFMVEKFALFIEIDGGYHERRYVYDCTRTLQLYEATGFTVLRFTNQDVIHNSEFVLYQINQTIGSYKKRGYHPPPNLEY